MDELHDPRQQTARLGRRRLFGAALSAPIALGVGQLATNDPAAAATEATASGTHGGSGAPFDPASPRFALAVLPDTQYLFDADSADPAPLRETFRWLSEHRAEANVAFLTHLGDVTEHGTTAEIALADATFRRIDGRLPYSVLAGNHDVSSSTDDQRGMTPYLKALGRNGSPASRRSAALRRTDTTACTSCVPRGVTG
jgi:hypothetical protein